VNEIKLGDVTVTRIEEMHGPTGMTPQQFFPTVPGRAWERHRSDLVPDHLGPDDGVVRTAMQTWLLRSEGRTILLDTGIGNDKERPGVPPWSHLASDYLGNLARAGVRPEDVDLVINSHLHLDHIGWNTRRVGGEWVPTFPNATYLMPAADVAFWDPAVNPGVADGVNANAYEDSVSPVRAQTRTWADEYVVDANLRLVAAPGHTPGSSVLVLGSGSDRALFAGDLLHTPVQLGEPEHSSCFCEDPAEAARSRRRWLGWAADHRALLLPAHFAGHGALEVRRQGEAFALEQWAPFSRLE
jgi:glyoxylase-like metal-dependent hydrolase (beta-lactamase superfamily II)